MIILGISAYYHDSAAAIVVDGKIVGAAQEERFTRKKHDPSFPLNAIRYCLKAADISPDQIDMVAFYDKPFLKFERLLETYLDYAPAGFNSFRAALPTWLKEKLFQKDLLVKELRKHFGEKINWRERLRFTEHHQSHAASAFFPSPFDEAAVLTLDGVGEWATTSLSVGNGSSLTPLREIHFPHSLGLLYSTFTQYAGFKVNSGEYKLMGLAPYGEPVFANTIRENLIDVKDDGSFRLNMEYFGYCTGLTMTNKRFDDLFGGPAREAEDVVTQKEMNVAASIQAITEEVILKLTKSIAIDTGQENLCLSGGVALNCVANGQVLRQGAFKNIWIQPAAGDAGGALGAALAVYHADGAKRVVDPTDSMRGAYLGPSYSQGAIEDELKSHSAVYEVLETDAMLDQCVGALVSGKAIGWHQGKMEFGPRALGGRSILADPRSPEMQKLLNLKVKYRESFRPFAPSVLSEDVSDWFELDTDSPYMLIVANIDPKHRRQMSDDEKSLFGIEQLNVPRSSIPAVTHVDYSARVQTVHKDTNPLFHALISKFKAATGCPILVNTSFNVRGEPIVSTPGDAFKCFMGTGIEILAVGNCLLRKEDQDSSLAKNYETLFELD